MDTSVDRDESLRRLARISAVPLALGGLFTILCWVAAGATLGLFLGGIAVATLLTPALVLREDHWLERLFAAGGVIDGVGIVWLAAIFFSPVTFVQWLGCYILLAAYVTALWGAGSALMRLRLGGVGAAAVTTVVALLWLAWPVWMAPWLRGPGGERAAAWLVAAHPLLSINGLLSHLGIWTEHGVMYHLVELGQHVRYALPASILAAAVVHLLTGAALLLAAGAGPEDRPPPPADR